MCERILHDVVIRGCSRLAAASLLLKLEASYDLLSFFVFSTYIIAISMNSVKPSHISKLLNLLIK